MEWCIMEWFVVERHFMDWFMFRLFMFMVNMVINKFRPTLFNNILYRDVSGRRLRVNGIMMNWLIVIRFMIFWLRLMVNWLMLNRLMVWGYVNGLKSMFMGRTWDNVAGRMRWDRGKWDVVMMGMVLVMNNWK